MAEHNDTDILKYTFYISGVKVEVSGEWHNREAIKAVAREISDKVRG